MTKIGLFARLLPGFLVIAFLTGCGGTPAAAPVTAAPLVWVSPTTGTLTYTVGTAITPIALSTTGGTGSITYSVNSGTLPQGLQIVGNHVTGTPTAPTVVSGNVVSFLATDSATPTTVTAVSASVTLIANPVTLAITSSTLPTGTVGVGYSYQLTSTGGTGAITWSLAAGSLTSTGLTLSSAGLLSGTPTSTESGLSLTFQAKDSATNQQQTVTKTLALTVTNVLTISGQITSNLLCSAGGLNGITVSINTTPIQTTTTSGSGTFSFSNVPNGTYTITPSVVGQGSIFYPSTQSVTVNGSNLTAVNFGATLFNTVSGTVTYTGTQTGQIYLTLNSSCGGGASLGTSISAGGAFTIRGVPAGPYTLHGFMDTLGKGSANASNPSSGTTSMLVLSDVTGASVTLADPATVPLSTGPTLSSVNAFNTGALARFKAITNSSGVEMATSYTLQWSTVSSFATIAGSKTFPANGTDQNVWFVNGLSNTSVYYFRAYGTSAGTAVSPYSSTVGPITIGAPSGGNTVTGAVSFTGAATGPLFVGFVDQNTNIVYGQYIANPVSAQAYSVQVPTGSNYFFFGVLDQNNDGIIDAGDISNTGNGNDQAVTVITGPMANENLTLPGAAGIATVRTQNYQSISSGGGTSQSYSINFQINGLIKLPVAVALASGPNLINPIDIAACSGGNSACGQGFGSSFNIYASVPSVGDSYTFNVTYSDGTTGTLTATVTAVLNAFATNLAPQTGTSVSTTPTFTWTNPINASSYTYNFYMNDSNGNTIWQIPGKNSNSNGFTSSITSIPWITSGNDVTGASGNLPSVTALTLGTNYYWQIQVQDSNGNSAVTQVQYQP